MCYLTLNFLPSWIIPSLTKIFFDILSKVVIGKKISEDKTVANITFGEVQDIFENGESTTTFINSLIHPLKNQSKRLEEIS